MSAADPVGADLDLHAPNPMHHRSGPGDAWSTTNTRENYQGVMSPLGATLWLPISDLAVNGTFHDLGVLRRDQIRVEPAPGEATSAVFYGRYTAGINYFRRVSDLIPGTSGAAFEEQIFGSSRDDLPDRSSKRRYPVVAVKAPVTVARLPRTMREMTARLDAWWRFATSPAGLARPADAQFRQAFEMLEYAMRVHVTGTFIAQACSTPWPSWPARPAGPACTWSPPPATARWSRPSWSPRCTGCPGAPGAWRTSWPSTATAAPARWRCPTRPGGSARSWWSGWPPSTGRPVTGPTRRRRPPPGPDRGGPRSAGCWARCRGPGARPRGCCSSSRRCSSRCARRARPRWPVRSTARAPRAGPGAGSWSRPGCSTGSTMCST